MVMPAPPASNVLPSTERAEALPVNVWPPIVNVDREGVLTGDWGNISVLLPIIKLPNGPSVMGVPEMVIPGPPAESVVESMLNADGLAVNV